MKKRVVINGKPIPGVITGRTKVVKNAPPVPNVANAQPLSAQDDCPTQTCGGNSTGAAGFAKGLFYGKAAQGTRRKRLAICHTCDKVDSEGKPLFRKIDGKIYCGKPRLKKIWRNEQQDGCGCNLEYKTSRAEAACPHGLWKEERRDRIEDDVVTVLKLDADGIGDCVTAACVVAGLKKDFPDTQVALAVRSHLIQWAQLFSDSDAIYDVGRIPQRSQVFSLHTKHDQEGAATDATYTRHQQYADLAGCFPAMPSMTIPPEEQARVEKGPIPDIILAPFSVYQSRNWPLRRWLELEDLLIEAGREVMILDGPGDGARHNCFKSHRYWGQSAAFVAALIERCNLLISNDSGLAHLAGALGKRANVICGPTDGRKAFGFYKTIVTVQADKLPCGACYWNADKGYKRWCFSGCENLSRVQAKDLSRIMPVFIP